MRKKSATITTHELSASDLFRSHRGCIRAICVFFLLLTNKKGWLPGTSGSFNEYMFISASLPGVSVFTLSLEARTDIPTISEKETSFPHNCWLIHSFKSFSWNNNKIFIKQCMWNMSGQPYVIASLKFLFRAEYYSAVCIHHI